jgi:peptide/nickel transport system substrate-binding protein
LRSREITRKRVATIITVSVIIIVCISILVSRSFSCSGGPSEIKNRDTFVIADAFDIASLDPAYAYDTYSAGQIQNIYETLIKFDGDSTSEFIPALATEWTISEDGKTYRFKIRDGVSFHNGNPLTPEDVEYSFERGMVQDYTLGPQWMFFEPLFGLGNYTSRTDDGLVPLEEIESKVEVDGQWVQFNLATPYEPFLQILASS